MATECMLNSKNKVFKPYFLIGTCKIRKNLLAVNSRAEPTTRNFYLAIFMGSPSLRLSEVLSRFKNEKLF